MERGKRRASGEREEDREEGLAPPAVVTERERRARKKQKIESSKAGWGSVPVRGQYVPKALLEKKPYPEKKPFATDRRPSERERRPPYPSERKPPYPSERKPWKRERSPSPSHSEGPQKLSKQERRELFEAQVKEQDQAMWQQMPMYQMGMTPDQVQQWMQYGYDPTTGEMVAMTPMYDPNMDPNQQYMLQMQMQQQQVALMQQQQNAMMQQNQAQQVAQMMQQQTQMQQMEQNQRILQSVIQMQQAAEAQTTPVAMATPVMQEVVDAVPAVSLDAQMMYQVVAEKQGPVDPRLVAAAAAESASTSVDSTPTGPESGFPSLEQRWEQLGGLLESSQDEDKEEDIPKPPPRANPKSPKVLPPGWKKAKDELGTTYYYHKKTRRTQWEPPTVDPEPSPTEKPTRKRSKRKTETVEADSSTEDNRQLKEAFRRKMSEYVVSCLNPFRKPECKLGRINTTEDFKHLARKLTHAVMAKELKHCRHLEDLEVNENVRFKTREFVKKYMGRFGPAYKADGNSPIPNFEGSVRDDDDDDYV